ncbi:unnamed protein product [Boreogadus saida]
MKQTANSIREIRSVFTVSWEEIPSTRTGKRVIREQDAIAPRHQLLNDPYPDSPTLVYQQKIRSLLKPRRLSSPILNTVHHAGCRAGGSLGAQGGSLAAPGNDKSHSHTTL